MQWGGWLVAASATGAASTGAATAQDDEDDDEDDEDDDSLGWDDVVGGIAVTHGATAGGVAVANWLFNGEDVDPDDNLEDQLYFTAEAVAEGRENFEAEMVANYDVSDDQQTPYAQLAWSEIRTRVAQARAQGKSESEALQEASKALDEQTTRSLVNVIERWNTGVSALIEQITVDLDEGVGVFHIKANDGSEYRPARTDASNNDADGIEGTGDGSGNFFAQEKNVDTPVPASNLEGRESDLVEFGLFLIRDSGDPWRLNPTDDDEWTSWNDYSYNTSTVIAKHTDLGSATVLSPQTYHHATSSIHTAYNSITSDLSDYVSTMYKSFEEGIVDPADILTPTELFDKFATADEQSRMGAELAAVGALHPGADNLGFRAKVSHPGLESDSKWGQLYLMIEGSESLDVSSGQTIPASEYEIAYFGFESSDTEEWIVRILDGSEPLDILEAETLDRDYEVAVPVDSAGANGEVVVWDTGQQGEPPEPIEFPNDHPSWYVDIRGASNSSQHDVTAVETRDTDDGDATEYYISSTDLNDGEAIEYIAIKQDVTFEQTSTHVDDATTIDPEKVEATVKSYKELAEALEKLDSSPLEGSGSGFLDGGFSLAGRASTLIGGAILFILGLAGINLATS